MYKFKIRIISLTVLISMSLFWWWTYHGVIYSTSSDKQLTWYNHHNPQTNKQFSHRDIKNTSTYPPLSKFQDKVYNLDTEIGRDILRRTKDVCRDIVCSEFLQKEDFPHTKYCAHKTWKKHHHWWRHTHIKCRFIDGRNRYPVALASYPGSGNTWVRGLLQEVTGLCTGGVYCDITLRQNGYPGEGVRSGVVLAVKTHQVDPRWSGVHYDKDAPFTYYKRVEHIPIFSSAIVLVRNPFDAMVSEYNRQMDDSPANSHTQFRRPEEFGTNETWNDFVLKQAQTWKETLFAFLLNTHNHPVMVVRFEDLKKNTEMELIGMLNFLQVPYRQSQVRQCVDKGYSKYKRNEKKEFDHYTAQQREYVRNIIRETVNTLDGYSVNVSDYLEKTSAKQ